MVPNTRHNNDKNQVPVLMNLYSSKSRIALVQKYRNEIMDFLS